MEYPLIKNLISNKMKTSLLILCTAFLLSSCNSTSTQQESKADSSQAQPSNEAPLVEKVLTKEERDALTPDQILQSLKDGNNRFVNDNLTARNHSAQVRAAATGQYPKAVILSCLDSRIPVEDVFDKGIGDLFVARVAGNIVDEDILGSMEFGCKASGATMGWMGRRGSRARRRSRRRAPSTSASSSTGSRASRCRRARRRSRTSRSCAGPAPESATTR